MGAIVVVVASTLFLAAARDAREARTESAAPREITLTAKGYAFHTTDATNATSATEAAAGAAGAPETAAGGGPANPPLVLRAGERVRLTIRNEEPGPVDHNFKIPGLSVRCSAPIPPGEQTTLEFTVPKDGVYTYTCCSHPGMGGRVEIEGAAKTSTRTDTSPGETR
jgi:plastocyanin